MYYIYIYMWLARRRTCVHVQSVCLVSTSLAYDLFTMNLGFANSCGVELIIIYCVHSEKNCPSNKIFWLILKKNLVQDTLRIHSQLNVYCNQNFSTSRYNKKLIKINYNKKVKIFCIIIMPKSYYIIAKINSKN